MRTLSKKILCLFSFVFAVTLPAAVFAGCADEEAAVLESISITKAPAKTEYIVGEKFDSTGMEVTAYYDDDSSKAVTTYTYTPTGGLSFDDVIVVTYEENGVSKTAQQAITVIPDADLTGISVTTSPKKIVYTVGESFDKTGMVVTAEYDDGSTREVSGYTWSPTGALGLSDKEITISYTEGEITKTDTISIQVNKAAVSSLEITAGPEKLTYNLGDTFDPAGMEVSVVYNNGEKVPVDLQDCTVEPSGPLGVNDTAIKVSYIENDVTVSGYFIKKLLIEAPEVSENDMDVAEEILFSDESGYELSGGAVKSTWSSDGNTFDRLRCNKNADAAITFSHDYSGLKDKSMAGFCAIMSNGRGGTVIEISIDGENWTTVAEAGEGQNMIPADYKYPSSVINGKTASDTPNRNVFYCYYNIGKYLNEDTSVVYVRFSYQTISDKGWVGADTEGADLIHSFTFFNRLDLSRVTGEVTISELKVKTLPETEYYEGDTFDAEGLVLEAVWSDGSTTLIDSGFTWEPFGALKVEDVAVTVNYINGSINKSVEIPIKVSERASALVSIEVTILPDKTVYREGELFDAKGMIVTAIYEDGTMSAVAGYSVSPDGALTADISSLIIEYLDKQTELPIRVLETALTDEDKVVAEELLFTDSGNYILGTTGTTPAKKGVSRYFTDEEGTEAVRLRASKGDGAYIQFSYTYVDNADISKAGFMFYGLDTRLGTVIQISTDGENWDYLFKVTESGTTVINADWKEKADNIVGTKGGTDIDKNMYAMYFNISEYLKESRTVYIRFGYEEPEVTVKDSEGADIFGSITFYMKLDLSKVVA